MKKTNDIKACLILLLVAACSGSGQETAKVQSVKTDTVVSATEQTVLQYPGKVKASDNAALSFRVSGTISKIHVEDGARVRKGQLLAELDPTDYQVQLDATEAEYKQVKSEAERIMALYEDGGASASDNDKAVYGLKQITAKYNHHKDELSYTRLYAPFDGYVEKRLSEEHETVGAGMPVITMNASGRPEVEINLPASEYIRRDLFRQFHCTMNVYPGKRFALSPLYIIPKANANQLYTMRLRWDDADGPMPSPGMNAMVTIMCDAEGKNLLLVPSAALLHEKGKTSVFVYDANKKVVSQREVELVGLQSDGQATIASESVSAGDQVVSSGVHYIKDGDSVTPLSRSSQTNVGGLL